MASTTTAAAASRLLLGNGKSMSQLLRSQIFGSSRIVGSAAQNLERFQSLLICSQVFTTQKPIFAESYPVLQAGLLGSVLGEKQGILQNSNSAAGNQFGVVEARGFRREIEDEEKEVEGSDFEDEDFDADDFVDDSEDDDGDFDDEEDDEEYAGQRK
ncbi:pheromone-processing carboxypeptidase KEX1 [Carica papaya]|uniref:pheromone-processing carboxypeptidase KEX1 n=1 Tax=Carica papaya TaxID=3649 RepID=UPI000B8C72F5|nr:pheromone-processing carboxypeptidase KEX1 [Carica papaya]